jgi:hypothetical protein
MDTFPVKIRSEYDFLNNVLGTISVGKHMKAPDDYILSSIKKMIEDRLQIYSGYGEGGNKGSNTPHVEVIPL